MSTESPEASEVPPVPGAGDGTTLTVAYFGSLRRRIGVREESVHFDSGPVRVRDVLERLVERHGDELRDWFYNQFGWLDPRCLVFVDGEDLTETDGLEADVTGARELKLTIALPMTGGAT